MGLRRKKTFVTWHELALNVCLRVSVSVSHLEVVGVDPLRLGVDGQSEGAGVRVVEEEGDHFPLHKGELLRQFGAAIPRENFRLIVTLFRNHVCAIIQSLSKKFR